MPDKFIEFNNNFFEQSLQVKAINDHTFVIKYFSQDSRIDDNAHLYCFIGIKGEKFDGNNFFQNAYSKGIRVFILEKKPEYIPSDAIVYLVENTIEAIANMAHLYKKHISVPTVMITGSVGKTTTRQILTAVLSEKFTVHTAKKNWNNAIGLPLTVLETPSDTEWLILEAGMSSKGEIAHLSKIVNPEIAVITNIGLSHSEFLGSESQVAEAKIEITEGMDQNSLLLINLNDPYKELFVSKAKGKVIYFDPNQLSVVQDNNVKGFTFIHKECPDVQFDCPLPGKHLLLNLSIIFALKERFDISVNDIQVGLTKIQGLDNRMRVFQTSNKATVIADCYNASLESFKASLDVLNMCKGRKIAVIGSVLELGDQAETIHRQIGDYINQKNIDLVLAVGKEIEYTCHELKIPYCYFDNKEDIWYTLKSEIKEGDTVLVKASNGIGLGIIVECLEQY